MIPSPTKVLARLSELRDPSTRVGLAVAQAAGKISVPDQTFASIRNTLSAVASFGLSHVLVTAPMVHDGGSELVIPSGVTLEFTANATVTVPANVQVGVVIMSTGSTLIGMRVLGNGSQKTIDRLAVTSVQGATDLTIRNVSSDAWHGAVIKLIDPSRVRVVGGRHTNITRSGDEGGAVRVVAFTVDVVDVVIEQVRVEHCAGTALQMEGDWDRSDWRTGGVKVRASRIVNCSVEFCGFAGVFFNSGFGCVIDSCTALSCGDIGIDTEFCYATTVVACVARKCSNFGFAVYQGGEGITFAGCTATESGAGFCFHHGQLPHPDNTPTNGIAVVGCVSQDNLADGYLTQQLVTNLTFSACTAARNAANGWNVPGVNVHLTGCISQNNTGHGVYYGLADDITITGGSIHNNGGDGINGVASGANPAQQALITGVMLRANAFSAIRGSSDTFRVRVVNCDIEDHTNNDHPAVQLDAGDGHTVSDCRFSNNKRNIYTNFGRRLTIAGNTIYLLGGQVAFELAGSGSSPGGTIRDNKVYGSGPNGGDRGLYLQTVADGAALFIEDNDYTDVQTWYQPVGIDPTWPIFWRGRVPVTPNGNIHASVGSMVQWTGGAAGTTLWVKETGKVTNTGWVGK